MARGWADEIGLHCAERAAAWEQKKTKKSIRPYMYICSIYGYLNEWRSVRVLVMYVCMYVCMYTLISGGMYVCMYVYMYVCCMYVEITKQ